jgi:hypothetical protein
MKWIKKYWEIVKKYFSTYCSLYKKSISLYRPYIGLQLAFATHMTGLHYFVYKLNMDLSRFILETKIL